MERVKSSELIKFLKNNLNLLNEWEKEFIVSLNKQFEDINFITKKQYNTLLRVVKSVFFQKYYENFKHDSSRI